MCWLPEGVGGWYSKLKPSEDRNQHQAWQNIARNCRLHFPVYSFHQMVRNLFKNGFSYLAQFVCVGTIYLFIPLPRICLYLFLEREERGAGGASM